VALDLDSQGDLVEVVKGVDGVEQALVVLVVEVEELIAWFTALLLTGWAAFKYGFAKNKA